jgi:amino acid adenylation domain-containing protein
VQRHRELQPLHRWFADSVRAHPQRTAVIDRADVLSYAQLAERVSVLAQWLRRRGVGAGCLVGVCMQRSAEAVVALLATLTTGAAFVPLDPRWPPARLRSVMDRTGAALMLADPGLAASLGHEVPGMVEFPPSAGTPPPLSGPDDLSAVGYVYFTSGSTGEPKGVVIDHRCAAGRIAELLRRFPLAPGDRIPFKTPLSFDVAVWDVFGPLTAGATIEVVPAYAEADVERLQAVLTGRHLVGAHFVPSMLAAYLQHAAPASYPGLRWVMTSGEAMPSRLLRLFDRHFPPSVEYHNMYGQSESSEVTAWSGRSHDGDLVPLGHPIGGYRVVVLDDDLRVAPPGRIGNLGVSAPGGLAHGYLGRPDLTAEHFMPHPDPNEPGERIYLTGDLAYADGDVLHFCGRVDRQVKVWGCRVELAEVESVIAAHPGVTHCVVILRRGDDTGPAGHRGLPDAPARPATGSPAHDVAAELVAYLTGDPVAPERLREHVAAQLPWFMVPAAYVHLDALPLLPLGKLDIGALPAPQPDSRTSTRPDRRPRSALRNVLTALWAQTLHLHDAGPDDDFFDSGGTSLKATVYLHRVGTETGTRISAEAFRAVPTIAHLEQLIEATREVTPDGADPPAGAGAGRQR